MKTLKLPTKNIKLTSKKRENIHVTQKKCGELNTTGGR
jgi:hypothetical protein